MHEGTGATVDRSDSTALRGTWLGTLLRWWNPVMRRLLASPFHWPLSRWFMLLAWRGHRTGRLHTTPVSYVAEEGRIWVTTGDRWSRQFSHRRAAAIRIAGRWRRAHGAAVTDLDESTRLHAKLFRRHPFFRRLAGIASGGRSVRDMAAVKRAVEAGRTLIRIEVA